MNKSKLFKWGFIALLFIGILVAGGYVLSWIGEGAQVAKEEFGPRAMLKKYEWFKDASAQLDKKLSDIKIYEKRMKNMKKSYEKIPRYKWSRTDKETYNMWSSELAGIKASYNNLAAKYNAQMSKFNWEFANKGQLPKRVVIDVPEGVTDTLPRKYKPYIEE